MNKNNNGPMLNAYPDSLGGNLSDIANFLSKNELKDVFSSFYILPSLFHTDLDRGFSVIDYSLNELFAKKEDLKKLDELGIDLKLDFILNHASVLSKQFQDIIKNGEKSKYRDFFIDWNKFWDGCGEMTEAGYIQPKPELIKDMFFRKPGLPILMVRFPDGKEVPYWNTFYQEVRYPSLDAVDIRDITGVQYSIAEGLASLLNESLIEGKSPEKILNESNIYSNKLSDDQRKELCEKLESERKYLGQMDLNIKSPLVWEFYDNTLKTLVDYGAKIVRLDAFAYAPKEVGEKNFLNEPATWDVLTKVRELADKYNVRLLPEIHASYEEKIYEKIADKGYMTYDFFLPGLIIDAFEQQSGEVLKKWADELVEKNIQVVNMLGCHDGIPLLDLKGLISEERIQSIIDTVVKRGGYVKDLHGQKNVYYQVNATYYSALGEEDKRMLLARAIQIFMPGKPQVWYLDLFAGKNDHEAVKRAGAGGHKEINRTNLTLEEIEAGLQREVVQKQLEMLRFRNTFSVFSNYSEFTMKCDGSKIFIEWKNEDSSAVLEGDLTSFAFNIIGEKDGKVIYKENFL
ncbi:alpha-amylase family glycosyl hydrolase [Lachnoanaerobaculum umeaense]|uniref:Glycosidase n=1 Tax=Lachnoanaerobaculum umeaense TaxID=617123 RepID=A0A385Q3G2_9FIRM|nr:glycosidase [Lachnoanaerobaculum umeaense]AYB00851.1 glycosidase [Lachnoanaerobaculum umeaense]PZW99897.1 sucrose phosphorylase [Lachnoanaerobaculum umeaense]